MSCFLKKANVCTSGLGLNLNSKSTVATAPPALSKLPDQPVKHSFCVEGKPGYPPVILHQDHDGIYILNSNPQERSFLPIHDEVRKLGNEGKF